MRPRPQEDITGNKGPILRKTRTSLGRPLRSNLSLERRLLLPKVFRRPRTDSTMEHKTFEEVLLVRNLLHFKFIIFISVCTTVITFVIHRSIIHESIIHVCLSMIIHELFINKIMSNTQELFLGDVPRISVIKISNQKLFIHS